MNEETRVRAHTTVPLSPIETFRLFTQEVDTWWRHGKRFRVALNGQEGVIRFEHHQGGRLLEVNDNGAGEVFERGRILTWEPGKRLAFLFRGRDFAANEWTTVEIEFERVQRGTRVSVEHYGFDALGRDHDIWHGQDPDAFIGSMGLWWGDLLVSLQMAGVEDRP